VVASPGEERTFSTHRVMLMAGILVLVGAIGELVLLRSLAGALSLTLAGVVAIINFRWLEAVIDRTIQVGRSRLSPGTLLRLFGRLSLLGLVFAAMAFVPGIKPVAIALGFSALVVALVIEGLWGARAGGE
jgi:hypothetical protein